MRKKEKLKSINTENVKMLNAFYEIGKGDQLSVEQHEISPEKMNKHPKSLNTNYRRKIAMEID